MHDAPLDPNSVMTIRNPQLDCASEFSMEEQAVILYQSILTL